LSEQRKHKRLSISELKRLSGKDFSDESAEDTINSIEQFAFLMYELFKKEKEKEANQKVKNIASKDYETKSH
jgi:hypothetical protein